MNPIELTPEIKAHVVELYSYIDQVESELKISIDGSEGDEVAWHLLKRIELQGHTPRMRELSLRIYNWCKGKAGEEAMFDEKILKAKESLVRLWISGKLSEADALYEKSEQSIKTLERTTEGLRSILSRDKELVRQSNFQK